jgi:O-antigen ligase
MSQINDEALLPRFAFLSFTFLVVYIIFILSRDSIQLKNGVNVITLVGTAYYLFNLINSFKSHNPADGIFESQRVLLFVLILFFSFIAIKDGKLFLTIFIKLTLFIGALTILFAAYQYSKIYGIGDPWYFYTIYSFNAHKNLFSSYLFLLLTFSIAGTFNLQDLKWKVFCVLSSVAYFFFIVLVQTRATWLGLLTALMFFIIHFSISKFFNKPKIISSALITIIFIALVGCSSNTQNSVVGSYFEKMKFWKYSESYSGNERIVLWKKTMSLFKDNWLTGSGTGDWQISFLKYGSEGLEIPFRANITFQRPHNDWLWVLSEQGIIGFVLFSFLMIFPFYLALKTFYRNGKKDIQLLVFLSGWIGIVVISFFDFPKERFEHLILIGVLIAILYSNSSKNDPIKIPLKFSPYIFLIIPILLCFNLLVAKKRIDGEKNAYQMFQSYKKSDFLA